MQPAPDTPQPDDLDNAGESEAPESPFALVAQFFIIPLAVVAIAVTIFVLFGMLSGGSSSPTELVTEVRTGSVTRRWQAAYQLATELAKNPELSQDEELFRVTLGAMQSSKDLAVRRYLVLALGHFQRPEAAPALIACLDGDDEETRLYAAIALGSLGDRAAVDPLMRMLTVEQPALRKAAALALGHLGDPRAIATLRPVADDRHFDVALQGALALAQLGDEHGLGTLHRALDRATLQAATGDDPEHRMDDVHQTEAILNALEGIRQLGDSSARPLIERLARADTSLRVQDGARRVLTTLAPAPEASPAAP